METISLDPAFVTVLRIALTMQHPGPQFAKALDKALAALIGGTPYTFDGRELTIRSASDPNQTHTTDGAGCPCRGGSHAWCYHRAAWTFLVAYTALTDPFALLAPAAYTPDSDVYAAAP